MERLIVIGDVHGCLNELEDLLNDLRLRESDKLLFLGDLINNGPDSHGVVKLVRHLGATSLLGNHERRLLWFRRTGNPAILKKQDHRTVAELTKKDWIFMAKMPLTWQSPDGSLVLAHGGFLPHLPWKTQNATVVTNLKFLPPEAHPPHPRTHWAEMWKGPPLVVYGHTPRPAVDYRRWSIGIDTGCYQGGQLTAFIWPEKSFRQVPARRKYA
ncbi:MAG: metallophosphoesterase [Opitutales bacterium]|nr:metallophosphoesterase [Opitutales bacterium]